MASRNELPGARPQLQVSYAPLTSKWVGTVGSGFLVAALTAPILVSCKNPFAGPFDDALDAMGKAFERNGTLGQCVTKAPTSEWKIRTPDGEQSFPDLRAKFLRIAMADGTECIPEAKLNLLKEQFEGIKVTLKHCPKGACSVTWPQQQTLSIP